MTDKNHDRPKALRGTGVQASRWALTRRATHGGKRGSSDTTIAPRPSDWRSAYGWLLAPAAISVLLLAGSIVPEVPLERLDSATAIGDDIRLVLPPTYLALDPICRLLDTLTLLTLGQLGSLWGTLIGACAAYGALTGRGRSASHRWRQGAIWAVTATAVILAISAAGILLPRPMAALAVQSPNLMTIDFHSHTNASHDGRPGFDSEANRAWHVAGGFNVAYLSDHANWKAIGAAEKQNPAVAGAGTMLLSAVEVRLGRYYVVALGPEAQYEPALKGNLLDDDARYAGARRGSLIYTLPLPPLDLQSSSVPRFKDVSAIEICDASPRGLAQSQEYHETLLAWADDMNVPVVASSNNHGWGRTAACWTLMEVPGWRQMDQNRLSSAIEQNLRGGRKATSVVAMRPPVGELTGWRTLALAPMLVMYLTRSLGAAERCSWIAYVWGWALMCRRWRQSRSQVGSDPVRVAVQ
ncbi:MAG: hypothetical protein JWQ90_2381 [Hydrocarboniphaga sp.]|uniref:hypothetical protein n=1 Tax=Hydrocarboniphaga sp. TaxID=2033016 RepID=UPI00262C18A2|nr:hypothetical protein [Hydrocarboniphaga sp.]MDB5969931.1 hypothetical protein [Hydrocarboniphaga sp.]